MEIEQLKKAVLLNSRLKNLNEIKSRILCPERDAKLTYRYKCLVYFDLADVLRECISDILDKHDKMIRTEIEERIKQIEKEIEGL